MTLSVGIVGLPNAGKSTLFNALLSKQQALAANYPFATIEPNVGVVPVPDSRLEKLAEIVSYGVTKSLGKVLNNSVTQSLVNLPPIVPATVQFTDIAGLVAGAHKGEGLGNKFLSHIREVDLICHVLRGFEDAEVVHVVGEVNPKRDLEIVETELILADLETLEKQREPKRNAEKDEIKRWPIIERLQEGLNHNKRALAVVTDEEERELVRDLNLLTMKKYLYVLNVGESEIGEALKNLPEPLTEENTVVVSAKIEAELADLDTEEQKDYLAELGLQESGLERLIAKAYTLLGLMSFLTAPASAEATARQGVKWEVRAWTIRQGTTAPKAAGVIHTDFEAHFIKAEVIGYGEFVKAGGWVKAREQGKVRLEGRDYVMRDGDVVDFKIGT